MEDFRAASEHWEDDWATGEALLTLTDWANIDFIGFADSSYNGKV